VKTFCGTERYMAPEILLKKEYDGKSVDIFAAGIVLFNMCLGHSPFFKALESDPYYNLLITNKKKLF